MALRSTRPGELVLLVELRSRVDHWTEVYQTGSLDGCRRGDRQRRCCVRYREAGPLTDGILSTVHVRVLGTWAVSPQASSGRLSGQSGKGRSLVYDFQQEGRERQLSGAQVINLGSAAGPISR